MDPSSFAHYGGSSSQGLHATSGMLAGLSLCATGRSAGVTPVMIARETGLHHIAASMREMSVKHNNAYNVFQIPLKTILIKTLQSVGIEHPDFKLVNCGGCFVVTITMLVGARKTTAAGDVCKTPELAEAAAIERAFTQLGKMHNIRVVDISARKQKANVRTGQGHYHKVLSGFSVVNWMMKKWKNCLDNFTALELYTREKIKEGNHLNVPFAEMLFHRLLIKKENTLNKIECLVEKIRAVTSENNRYVAAARSKPFFSYMASKTKAYFPDVDSLALFLQWLKLDECKYSAHVSDNGFWIGVVELTLSDGNQSIVAKDHKRTIPKAYNAAAREAISYLEELFNVDVAGYNHAACVYSDQETYVWKGLKDEVSMLGVAVLEYWEDMLGRLAHCIKEQKKALPMVGAGSVLGSDLVKRLDIAYGKCRESFQVAGVKFASLN